MVEDVNEKVLGGQIDLLVRSDSLEDLESDMLLVGLSYTVTEEVFDEETGLTTLLDTGETRLSKGVTVDILEGIEVKPAVYSGETLVEEAVVDPRVYANIRIRPPSSLVVDEEGNNIVHGWIEDWFQYGSPDYDQNKNEEGSVMFKTTLLKQESIRTPKRVFL